jgi:hypothetical protein
VISVDGKLRRENAVLRAKVEKIEDSKKVIEELVKRIMAFEKKLHKNSKRM